ncbi:GNAT family N-acetyltransferase [Gemella cuniculi]|uniref:GNAT family N-acetyltransferase n=1 Tax=Gemella cuniculi TaxID=150240 RepID=UPI00041BC6C4|nr:GNAT family N-acetyltransferase [Gemella cuniculi]
MKYSFKNIHSKAKVAIETDKYIIYQTLKSKLYFGGNYLLMKEVADSVEDIDYYIAACRNFFKDKGVNFIHIASVENTALSKKLKKYLKKENYNEINLDLYHLAVEDFMEQEKSNYKIEFLQRVDFSKYLSFQYRIDLESSNNEWANHNQELLYEDIRSENIKQLIIKDDDKIIGTVNIIEKDDFFEIDNLYVDEKYRKQGIASHLISFAIKNENKSNVLLVADANDTPKYMYEKMGFKKISEQDFYLKSDV